MDNNEHDLEALLQENLRIARENNKMLKKIRSAHLIDVWFRILLLLVAVGAPIFVYQYYLKDYIDGALDSYQQFKTNIEKVSELPASFFNK